MTDVADEIHVGALLKSLDRVGASADDVRKLSSAATTAAPPSPPAALPGSPAPLS